MRILIILTFATLFISLKLNAQTKGRFGTSPGYTFVDWTFDENWGGSANRWSGYIGFNAYRNDNDPKDYFFGVNCYTAKLVLEGSNYGFRWLYRKIGQENQHQHQLTELMHLSQKGFLGVGVNNPLDKMHVENGNLRITNDTRTGGDGKASIIFSKTSNSFNAHARITYHGDDMSGVENYLGFGLGDPVSKDCNQLVIKRSGNIGVGTSMPDYKLDVLGTIRARELKVDMQGADFVFEENYPLRPISELEDFVKVNKHLPEIAPAKEMQANGVNQSEMNQKLLQKIEELTLYTIEQQRQLDIQKKLIEQLIGN